MGFELGCSVDMVLGAPVEYPLEYYIKMLLGLALENSLGTWEGSLVGFSLVPADGLIIGSVYRSLV